MSPFRKIVILAVLVLSSLLRPADVSAQVTRVRGRVIDAFTGEGIPFAGVYFKNSTVGVTNLFVSFVRSVFALRLRFLDKPSGRAERR